MKRWILCVFLGLSSCINPQEAPDKGKVIQGMANTIAMKFSKAPQLTIEDFQKNYAKKPNTLIVDVRSEEEQKVSLIPGAITRKSFEANQEKYKDKTIVTYCTIGQRSSQYTVRLVNKGFKAYNLKESILGWANRRLPIVTPQGEETKRVHVYGEAWNLLPKEYQGVWDE